MNLNCPGFFCSPSNNFMLKKTDISLELPNHCPYCHTGVSNSPVLTIISEEGKPPLQAYSIHYCPSCNEIYFSHSIPTNPMRESALYRDTITIPRERGNSDFSSAISKNFPDFTRIYNQSLTAESEQLDEIAGMGYRKALEFLIKDYAILRNPDKREEIARMSLSACINNYIESSKLVTLSKASSWLGNDHVHYLKKHNAYDINNLKSFIKALAYFISCELSIDDASSLLNE